jgi:hypothetical protein
MLGVVSGIGTLAVGCYAVIAAFSKATYYGAGNN